MVDDRRISRHEKGRVDDSKGWEGVDGLRTARYGKDQMIEERGRWQNNSKVWKGNDSGRIARNGKGAYLNTQIHPNFVRLVVINPSYKTLNFRTALLS